MMKKLVVILFLGILVACSGDNMAGEEGEMAEPINITTHVNEVNTDNKTGEQSNVDVPIENDKPKITIDLVENQEVISGIIEIIDNNRFEMYETVTEDSGNSSEVFMRVAEHRTVILINDITTFEVAQSDGMNILDRWDATSADMSENLSVTVTGHHNGTEFLATHIKIWQFPWN